MEFSDGTFPMVDNNLDYYRSSPCHTRQYLMCPHCSYHLCFEHDQQSSKEIPSELLNLHNRAKYLANLLRQSEPVQSIIEEVFNALKEWKEKMFHFIDQYTQQIQIHIERAQHRLDEHWNITKKEYLQILDQFLLKPVDQLLQISEQIHPDEVRDIYTRFTNIEDQISNLLSCRDLLRINFDTCSLTGDINISRGHFPPPTIHSLTSPSSQPPENLPHLDRIDLLYRFDDLSSNTSSLGVSSSSRIFVTSVTPNTLAVFDAEQGLIKHVNVEPAFVSINDIIWCDYFNLFLLAGAALHTFDAISTEVKEIFTPEDPQIWSITTHKTNLYVCYLMGESPLIEHRSFPSFRIIERYTRSQVLPTNSPSIVEIARCIRANHSHLAMTIRNLDTYEWRVDLFNFHFQRLSKGQIFGYAAHSDYWCCLLTSYRSSWWLIMNNTSAQETLTLIDKQARVKQQIQHEGYNLAVLQGEQRLLIKDQQGLAIFRL